VTWNEVTISSLLQRLEGGWTQQSALPQSFLECWKERIGDHVSLKEVDSNLLYFTADLSSIHLRGTEEVHCILMSGAGDISQAKKVYNQAIAPGRLVFLWCASDAASQALGDLATLSRCMFLTRIELNNVMMSACTHQMLRVLLPQKVNRSSLIPFNITLCAQGNMFYGRMEEMEKLIAEDEVTFAVAGPSRIGKTSLVKEYISTLTRRKHYLAQSTKYIDCYECGDWTDSGLTNFLAMRMDGSSYANRVQISNFPQFLKYLRSKLGQLPNIVLDETDELSQSAVFRQLSTLSKNKFCRIIFCGRGKLLNAALESPSMLGGRFELVRLKALAPAVARRLLVEPLNDLGIATDRSVEAIERVLTLTGCLPHQVQFFGQRLSELCIREKTTMISMAQVDLLQWDFETAQYFASPLADISSPEGKLVALSILKKRLKSINYASVSELAREHGVSLSLADTKRVCNDLVICNILTWTGDSLQSIRETAEPSTAQATFCISSEALSDYAEKMGYLTHGLQEVKQLIHKKTASEKPQ
jgi:hypothetical protein